MAQWLRLGSSNASAVGSVRELRSLMSCNVAKKIFFKILNICVCVLLIFGFQLFGDLFFLSENRKNFQDSLVCAMGPPWIALANPKWSYGKTWEESSSAFSVERQLALCVVVQSLSRVQLFAAPRTAARQAPLSFTISTKFAQICVHWVGNAVQPSHPLSSPSPASHLSQHQGLF